MPSAGTRLHSVCSAYPHRTKAGAFLTRNTLAWLIPILMFSGLFYILRNVIDGSTRLPRGGEAEQMAPEIEQPLSLRVLMWWSLLTGVSGILDIFLTHPLFLSKYALSETRAQRVATVVFGVSFLPLFWGIRRRMLVAWKFGWLLLVETFSFLLVGTLESLRKQPDSGGWIAYAAVTIGFSFVAIYWGRWWYRQRRYFPNPGF
jgi:hypothetical protein